MNAIHVRTFGLKCGECTGLVEKSVSSLDGVIGVMSVQAADITSVMFDESRVNGEAIIASIRDAGFEAERVDHPDEGVST